MEFSHKSRVLSCIIRGFASLMWFTSGWTSRDGCGPVYRDIIEDPIFQESQRGGRFLQYLECNGGLRLMI